MISFSPSNLLHCTVVFHGNKMMFHVTWVLNTHLLLRERAMGTMEKTERARVMTPIMSPPVLRLTQQQHLWKHGMMV